MGDWDGFWESEEEVVARRQRLDEARQEAMAQIKAKEEDEALIKYLGKQQIDYNRDRYKIVNGEVVAINDIPLKKKKEPDINKIINSKAKIEELINISEKVFLIDLLRIRIETLKEMKANGHIGTEFKTKMCKTIIKKLQK